MSRWMIKDLINSAIKNESPTSAIHALTKARQNDYQVPLDKKMALLMILIKDKEASLTALNSWNGFDFNYTQRLFIISSLCSWYDETIVKNLIETKMVFTQQELMIVVSTILGMKSYSLLKLLDDSYGLPKYIDDIVSMAGVGHAIMDDTTSN